MKSIEKLKNYLENYTRTSYFIDRVLKIREEIGLPTEGIPFPEGTQVYDLDFPASVLGIEYKGKRYHTFPAKRSIIYNELLTRLPKIYKKIDIILFINTFILFNERRYDIFTRFYNKVDNTVSLVEYRSEYLEREGCCDCEVAVCEGYMKKTSEEYPMMIGISPYASQNEVIDLIKERWDYIELYFKELEERGEIPLFTQEKKVLHQVRNRKKSSKDIEDIVYANRELSLDNLRDLIKDKTGVILDPGEVGKIRSLAKKRREI